MALMSAPLILSGLATSFNEVKDVYALKAICHFNTAKIGRHKANKRIDYVAINSKIHEALHA